MPWRERAHPKIPSSSIFLCLGATHVDFKALLCKLSGPHSIGTLFPLSQREIIESEEGKKRGRKTGGRTRESRRDSLENRQRLQAWIASQSVMEQDWEVATQQDTALGRDCRAVGWDSRGEMGSEGRESRRGGELCLGEALSPYQSLKGSLTSHLHTVIFINVPS